MTPGATSQTVTFRRVLRNRSFSAIYIAEVQSIIGDQLARFALSVLVFDRTGSATAAALTYAVSFLPAIAGGILLGRLGDRYDQRVVMVCSDLLRAALFVVMSISALDVGAVVAVLAVAVFIGPAFSSAEVSYLATALAPEEFRTATALRSASNQMAQVVGFAVGGAVVALFGARGALLIDAGTFVLSAALVVAGSRRVRPRTLVPPHETDSAQGAAGEVDEQFQGLWRDSGARVFMTLTLLIGLFVVPEGLVVPFGHRIHASVAQSGVLVAMIPLGSALGAALIVRVGASRRRKAASWMAVGCGLPLLFSAADPIWPIACACWFVSGVLAAYQVEAITALVGALPARERSRLIGVIGACLLGAQGAGFALSGLLSTFLGPGAAIAVCAGGGSWLALALAVRPGLRGSDKRARHVVGATPSSG